MPTTPLRTLLTCAVLLACFSAGCAPDEEMRGDGRKILRVAYPREIDVLNPYTSQNLVDISFSMIEGLITASADNTYVPVLAREIPTEENGLIVHNDDGSLDMTWRLHENVRWHDGEALTSEDVCFTWRFVASEGSQTYNRDQYLGILECLTPDEHTVVFRWDGEYAFYAGIFEAVLPEHVLGGMTTEEIVNFEPYNRGSRLVGTGPFKFAEWKSGEYIRVVRNDDYWRGPEYPALDEIVWSFIPDNNTRLNAIKAGGFHYGQIESKQVKELADREDYRVHLTPQNSVMHFDMNVTTDRGRQLFGDQAVRKALFHAIDRTAIADLLMEGTVQVAHAFLNPSSPYHNAGVMRYGFDVARASELLDSAGWIRGADGIRVKNNQRFSFTMLNRAGASDRIAIAQVIQAQFKAVGVEVSFETLESAAWTQRWRGEDWEAVVSAWFLPSDPSLTGIYACDGPNNMTGHCDPALDEILRASDRELAFETRKPLLDEAQERIADLVFAIPIYHNVVPEVLGVGVGNFRPSGANFGSFWNLWEWTLDEENAGG